MRKKTEQDYHDLAASYGFLWRGKIPKKKTQGYTIWECDKGHRFKAKYNKLQQGCCCPICWKQRKKSDKDYLKLANEASLIYFGPFPKNTNTETYWQCKECDYLWFARYWNIYAGQRCPRCAGRLRKTREDYYGLAQEAGIIWIGDFPETTKHKTRWKCKICNNEWLTTYHEIQYGKGCPACVFIINGQQASKIQLKIAEMLHLEKYVNYPFNESRRRIDIAIPNKMIAIEYDSWYWHADKLDYDKQRQQELIDLGWRVLSIKSRESIPERSLVLNCIKQLDKTDYVELVLDDWGKGDFKRYK